MNADLDTLATALYVHIDDALIADPSLAPERPTVGTPVEMSDAELVTMAVLQGFLGFTSEARWLRHAQKDAELRAMFPYMPQRPGYNKRLRKSTPLMLSIMRMLAMDCDAWWDDLWLVDSTPVECGRSKETAERSDLVGWANHGYCANHSRWFWGLRLHLVATPAGLPVAFALADPKMDEREVARTLLHIDPALMAGRDFQTMMADKGYRSEEFEAELAAMGIVLIRPATKKEPERPGKRFLKPFRQIIESINQTLKAQLDLERHGGRKPDGVMARVVQRLLALTAAIWHNEKTGQPVRRSLVAYDH